ncbi:hypothetical protein [Oceanibaculum indicum]|uniref:Uncharacterized protein n=1 Tax=Oceanibaculum indicum P24 TaxID=1207063 RepID=K2JX63_9PROT|nr:hypothetical protein [Oceanibaculum indicum]EKE69830.1 hypothetical protein P24_16045 [Oceanibaculum indicum P24]
MSVSPMSVSSVLSTDLPADADHPAAGDPVLAHFRLTALADPNMLSRLLEHFAKRSLVPERWLSQRVDDTDGDLLQVEAECHLRDADTAQYVGRCLAQIPGVTGCVVLTG